MLLNFSVWVFLSKAFAFISYRIHIILIGLFLTPAYLTYYDIAFKVFELLKYGLSLLISTMIPIAANLQIGNNDSIMRLIIMRGTKYITAILFPMFIFVIFNYSFIIQIWLGNLYSETVNIGIIMVISLFPTVISALGGEMLVGLGKLKKLVVYSGTGSVINIVICLFLIRNYGLTGIVAALFIGTLVITSGYLHLILNEFDIDLKVFLKDSLMFQ
jgi:O-antigen/teichoic acid export membrane protein